MAGTDVNVHMKIYNHVRSGNWIATKDFLARHPEVISSNITDVGKTLLHMAVFLGHRHIVKELVDQMSVEQLKITDRLGYTALAETTLIGNKQMAECMLGKHMDLISITTKWGLLPVVLAVFHRKIEFARYLYQHTPLPSLQEKDGYNGGILIIISQYPFAVIIPNLRRIYFLIV